jgi:hypothetical protein
MGIAMRPCSIRLRHPGIFEMIDFEELNLDVSALGLPRQTKAALRKAGIGDAATLLSIAPRGLARLAALTSADVKAVRECLGGPVMRRFSAAMLEQVPIGDLGFDLRLRRLMMAYAINTAADLEAWLPDQLERIPGIGRTTVAHAFKAMALARRLGRARLRKALIAKDSAGVSSYATRHARYSPVEIEVQP